jgi:hypothetical protein
MTDGRRWFTSGIDQGSVSPNRLEFHMCTEAYRGEFDANFESQHSDKAHFSLKLASCTIQN